MTEKTHPVCSLISKDYLAVSNWQTVAESIELLRLRKNDFQNKLSYIYVVENFGRLAGVLRIRDLLAEKPSRLIDDLMQKSVSSVTADSSLEELVRLFRAHSLLAIPVVDHEKRLVGVIGADQLKKFVQPSMGERFNRLMGFGHEEIEGRSPYEIVLKRLPWLLISVTSGLVCAYIVGIFIGKVESIIALILFVPVILGLAGSIGTQSAAVTKRHLSEGKFVLRDAFRILGRELSVAFMLGAVAFLWCAAIALVWRKPPVEAIALGISLVGALFGSGILGIILPIAFRVLKIPLNSASGLFLLLICDIFALIVYFVISLSLVSPTLEIG